MSGRASLNIMALNLWGYLLFPRMLRILLDHVDPEFPPHMTLVDRINT